MRARGSHYGQSAAPWHSLSLDNDHPVDAKFVLRHSEARRKERLAEWHDNLSTIGQPIEKAIGIRLIFCIHGKREPVELGIASVAPIRSHDTRVTDLDRGVHHLVLVARRAH